jgi:hypothetical protein
MSFRAQAVTGNIKPRFLFACNSNIIEASSVVKASALSTQSTKILVKYVNIISKLVTKIACRF